MPCRSTWGRVRARARARARGRARGRARALLLVNFDLDVPWSGRKLAAYCVLLLRRV